MYDSEKLIAQAAACGFSHAAEVKTSTLEFLQEVRDMCAADRCQSYGKNWVCPPACGSLEAIREKASAYEAGILVQTTGEMEDDFDYEAIRETEARHKKNFLTLMAELREEYPDMLPMGSGACAICATCTYPDAPCRFPDRAFPSMEAYGLFVSQVCERAGLPYYYGPKTMTFTACFLLV